jgi:hypothetical protein
VLFQSPIQKVGCSWFFSLYGVCLKGKYKQGLGQARPETFGNFCLPGRH